MVISAYTLSDLTDRLHGEREESRMAPRASLRLDLVWKCEMRKQAYEDLSLISHFLSGPLVPWAIRPQLKSPNYPLASKPNYRRNHRKNEKFHANIPSMHKLTQ